MISAGGVPEWLNGTVLKTVRCRKVPQGFESSLLRQFFRRVNNMARVKIAKGGLREFLDEVLVKSRLDTESLGKVCGVSGRTIRDWRREKYNMNYEALLKLHKISGIPIPRFVEILPEYWSTKKASRLGALKRNELYGSPATPEGRRRGGLTTMRKFHEDPKFAKMIGLKLRTSMNCPNYSPALAEFIGIMLGDGYIKSNKTQTGISFNIETDYRHAKYIQGLIKRLFNLNSSINCDRDSKSAVVLVSSRNLVEFLISVGLKTRDKVVNQVDIPEWINLKKEYKISCLRGLIDTDGSFYSYLHKVFKKTYSNFAMCFTNHSLPLLRSVYKILKILGFNPILSNDRRIYLHKKKDIERYFREIGSNNSKHLKKYRDFITNNS